MNEWDKPYWIGQGIGLTAWGLSVTVGPLEGTREWTALLVGVLFGVAAVLMLWRRGER